MQFTRRQMLQVSGMGFGALALNCLEQQNIARAGNPATGLSPRQPHFEPRAKSVIMIMQNGGPSQMDLFDPKPELSKRDGQPHPHGVEVFQAENKKV